MRAGRAREELAWIDATAKNRDRAAALEHFFHQLVRLRSM